MNDIGWAVKQMWNGSRVRRAGWDGKGMWIAIRGAEPPANMLPFVYMRTAQAQFVPWTCSQSDLLSIDWEAIPVEE